MSVYPIQRDQQLFAQKMDEIKHSVWYRQRFDACPHFMFFLGDAHISAVQHTKYPFGQRIAYAGFSKNRADWYHSLPELEYTATHIIEAANINPEVSKQMVADFLPWQTAFYELCRHIDTVDLPSLSDDDLLETYTELATVYTKKLNASPLIDGFALSTDEKILGLIKTFLIEKWLEEKFVEYVEVLTAAVFSSFLQEEDIALLEMMKKIKQGEHKGVLLAEHQKQFFWMQNNYVKDHVLPVSFFEERMSLYEGVDLDEKIREIKNLPIDHSARKKKLMDEINLPEDIRVLLAITDDMNAWQDERKKGTFWATHYFSLLLEEFARRTEYTVEELKYCFPPEMHLVLEQKISREELRQRFEYCIILWTLDHYDVTTDKELITTLDKIGIGEFTTVAELTGFAAQLGKVQGRVKVLESAEEMYKVEEGDILVAVMTRPDYLPAMKKAIAFITDEGGITCHAAIVAREMKKPCIVGTKIATKMLKDGDMVEVDANRGSIRKM